MESNKGFFSGSFDTGSLEKTSLRGAMQFLPKAHSFTGHLSCSGQLESCQGKKFSWAQKNNTEIRNSMERYGCLIGIFAKPHRIHGTGIFTYMTGWFLW